MALLVISALQTFQSDLNYSCWFYDLESKCMHSKDSC